VLWIGGQADTVRGAANLGLDVTQVLFRYGLALLMEHADDILLVSLRCRGWIVGLTPVNMFCQCSAHATGCQCASWTTWKLCTPTLNTRCTGRTTWML
jgi:hypothetical protein